MAQKHTPQVAQEQEPAQMQTVPTPPAGLQRLLVGDKPHQFLTLDGLRGVAAVAVIAFHAPMLFAPIHFGGGYLAVDFFFLLSGFVLTHAYGRRLDGGWPTMAYLKTRVLRLYPLYLVGLVLGVFFHLGFDIARHVSLADGELGSSVLLGLLVLPRMPWPLRGSVTAFPLNYPSWSIFFELLVNLLQALFLRRRSTRTLAWVTVGSFLCVAWYSSVLGSINVGVNSPANLLCIFRVLLFYCLGTLLYRLWCSGRVRMRISPAVLAVTLLGLMSLPVPAGRWLVPEELLIAGCLFPTLLLLAANTEPGSRSRPLFRLLGQLSYPVYILHGPLLSAYEQLLVRVRPAAVGLCAPWSGLFLLPLLVLISLVADRWYDLPIRNALRRRLQPHAKAAA